MIIGRIVLTGVVLSCSLSQAANVEKQLTISGVVSATPPCVINENRPITVPFGDIAIASIDGVYKTTAVVYSLKCKDAPSLRMKLKGNYSANLRPLLEVPERDNLGIQIKVDGRPVEINTWFPMDNHRVPKLEAVLVKKQGGDIKSGVFRSSATLEVDYP